MHVPFNDLNLQYSTISTEIDEAISKVIKDNAFIQGKYVWEFESAFANFCEAEHCIGVGNGTDAIFIALKALGIGQGDEVIVPANSFIATSEAVSLTGAKVVFADVSSTYYTIDPSEIEKRVTPNTKAIIPVHLYGHPADMHRIKDIADCNHLHIIQDSAQAHGAKINGEPLSVFGGMQCFSFYPGKNLGAYGDAGAIVTNDEDLARRIKMFANHGRISKYDHEVEGINSRMDGLQGAILNVKLRYLDDWMRKRREIASSYHSLLRNIPEINTPQSREGFEPAYHLYVVRTEKRDHLKRYLEENDIITGIHYPIALPNLQAYRSMGHNPHDYPVSGKYQNEILSLPIYPELSEDMLQYVTEKIIYFFEIKKPGIREFF